MRRIMLLVVLAVVVAALMMAMGALPVTARQDANPEDTQSQGPPCGHDWCDWYQVCRWEYWAWDHDKGWTLVHTDGYCDTSG